MSPQNVEVVRRWLAAASRGPDEARAAVAEFCDGDVDYYPVRKVSWAQPCHGTEEFSQFLARWREAWSRLEWAVEELIEVGDDRVLACANLRAEGRGSGAKLEGDLYQCVWLRHGRLFRVEDHLTLSGALQALGLEGAALEAVGLREVGARRGTRRAMSQENAEVVRRGLAAMSAGPEEALAAVTGFCDAAVDYYPVRRFSEVQACHGVEEFSQFLARWLEPWSRLEWAVQELIEVGDDRVLACLNMRAEGRGSGMKLEADRYYCLWLRHGRLFRQEDHLTLSGALHALGLEGATLEAAGLRDG